MSTSSRPDPLQHLLADSETELQRRLREACDAEARGVLTGSTQEIRKLEDSLLKAAMAAEQTLTVRRHIETRDMIERSKPIAPGGADGAETTTSPGQSQAGATYDPAQPPKIQLREFTDPTGRGWRAWPVIPGLDRRTGADRRFLGDFHEGWICFESVDSSARRRLPRRHPNWADLPLSDLQGLLDEAIDAPIRKAIPPRAD